MGKRETIKDIKARKEEQRRRKKRRRRVFFLIGEMLVFFLLCSIWYGMKTVDQFQINKFGEGELQVNAGVSRPDYTTIALFGGDSRDGLLDVGTHTDAMMLLSIHNETRDVKLVSVYRDTITEQMDGQMKKANHAYFIGGAKEAINMLNKNFDLDIQGYVTVDFKALAEVVDLLGGIEIHVSKAEATEMNRYIGETSRIVEKDSKKVKKGLQILDGVQAVTYARIRKNVGGDYQRTDRQREVVETIIKGVKTTEIKTVKSIIDVMSENISTSLTVDEMMGMALNIEQFHMAETEAMPFDYTAGNVDGAGSVVIPTSLEENVKQLHAFLYNDEDYQVSKTVQDISAEIETITGA